MPAVGAVAESAAGAAERAQTSRMRYVPSIVLASLLALAVLGLWFESTYEQRAVREKDSSGNRAPRAAGAGGWRKSRRTLRRRRARTQVLDKARRRTKADIDVLAELTKDSCAPGVGSNARCDANDGGPRGRGRTERNAAEADRRLHRCFQNAEFLTPPARGQALEVFRIRTQREGVEQ